MRRERNGRGKVKKKGMAHQGRGGEGRQKRETERRWQRIRSRRNREDKEGDEGEEGGKSGGEARRQKGNRGKNVVEGKDEKERKGKVQNMRSNTRNNSKVAQEKGGTCNPPAILWSFFYRLDLSPVLYRKFKMK